MLATLYKRPHGATQEIDIQNIRPEDAEWFENNDVRISLEDIGVDTAVYADCGFKMDDDPEEDPDEVIVLAKGHSSEETMSALRAECEAQIVKRPRP